MATPKEQIKQLQDELIRLKETLKNYENLFKADGFIDTQEQQQLDFMQGVIKKAEAKLALLANKAPSSGGDKFTKPFYDGKVGKKYELYVLVDQPGTGGDRDTFEGLTAPDVGHTFVKLIKTNVDGTKVEAVLGFYPANSVNPLTGVIEVAGELVDDKGHTSEVQANKILTHDQFFAALAYIEKNRTRKYNLDTYNCTDFAIEVAGAAGWNIKSKKGVWPGGGGHNPGDLGEDLRNAKNTTTKKAKKGTQPTPTPDKKIK